MRRSVAIVATVVLIALIVIFALRKRAEETLVVSPAFAANLQHAEVISANALYFFTGSGFAEYDLRGHRTKLLTRIFSLPTVTEVKWSKAGVLFKASGYSPVDELHPILRSRFVSTAVPHWWLVNFATGQLQLLGDGSSQVTDTLWSEDGSYLFSAQPEKEDESKVSIFRSALDQRPQEIGDAANLVTLVWANKERVLFSARNERLELKELNSSSRKLTILPIEDFLGLAKASAGAERIAYLAQGKKPQSEGLVGDLRVYEVGTREDKRVLAQYSGSFNWNPNGNMLMGSGFTDNKPIVFSYEDGLRRLQLKAADENILEISKVLRTLSGLVLIDNADRAYLAAADRPQVQLLKDASVLQREAIYRDRYYIIYLEDKDQYSVYILSNPYRGVQAEVLSYIQSLGLDPNQLNIKWYADDGVDRST